MAIATSNLNVILSIDSSSSSVCSLDPNRVLSFTEPGTCTVDANQPGNGYWNAAPQSQQVVAVTLGNGVTPQGKSAQTIAFISTNPSPVTTGISKLEGGSPSSYATVTANSAVTFYEWTGYCDWVGNAGDQFAFGPSGHEVVYTVGDWCFGGISATRDTEAQEIATQMNAATNGSGAAFSAVATITAKEDVLTVMVNAPGSSMNGWDFRPGPNNFLWITGFSGAFTTYARWPRPPRACPLHSPLTALARPEHARFRVAW